MFRQARTIALVALAALGSLAVATAQESKKASGKTEGPPQELTVDLGGDVKLEMVLIQPGAFMMGSPKLDKQAKSETQPQHRVRITRPFYMGKYLVTQEQWQAVMGKNPSSFKGPKNPVEHVSWNDCQQFLSKLSAKTGRQKNPFVLPTEAQWEYACRAGTTTRFYFGDDAAQSGEYVWDSANSGGKTHPVGQKKPNAWGLCDMLGNVWEWCEDCYDAGYYANSPRTDPTGPATGTVRVFRGGCWVFPAKDCPSAGRLHGVPASSSFYVGVRIALPGPKAARVR